MILRAASILAFTATAAVAADKCASTLAMKYVAGAMDVRIQPVFVEGRLSHWRVFGIGKSAHLKSVAPDAVLTHVCGLSGAEIFDKDGTICCSGDASKQFEVTFKSADKPVKVLIRR